MEPEFNDSGAPATKADIAMVLQELRAFRVWVEGKFELVEQKFRGVDQKFELVEHKVEHKFELVDQKFETMHERIDAQTQRAIQTMTWRMAFMWASTVAVVIGTRAGS